MRKKYEKKIIDCKALDVDPSTRQVKFAYAKVDAIDRDKEVFDTSAFKKSIQENGPGPGGSNEIWHLLDHYGNSFSALSKQSEVGMDGQYLYGVSKYKDSFAWREVAWPLYESGDFTQHSIGFTTTKDETNSEGTRIIKEARIFEGSAVMWGAQPDTPVLQLFKSEFDEEMDPEELIYSRFERAIKRLKEDKFSDGNKSLLLIELLQLQNQFLTIAQKATKPDNLVTCPHCKQFTPDKEAGNGYIRCVNCNDTFPSKQKSTLPEADVKDIIKQAFKPIHTLLK